MAAHALSTQLKDGLFSVSKGLLVLVLGLVTVLGSLAIAGHYLFHASHPMRIAVHVLESIYRIDRPDTQLKLGSLSFSIPSHYMLDIKRSNVPLRSKAYIRYALDTGNPVLGVDALSYYFSGEDVVITAELSSLPTYDAVPRLLDTMAGDMNVDKRQQIDGLIHAPSSTQQNLFYVVSRSDDKLHFFACYPDSFNRTSICTSYFTYKRQMLIKYRIAAAHIKRYEEIEASLVTFLDKHLLNQERAPAPLPIGDS